ncbi:hypothetical protein ASPWEDRAFT_170996 [Aspergillus wentii DTO 134E9]|uniref:Urease accessory protein UreD n=1 Tax=Aspergillus wentii DTO 134E9 TaxID=1073089 RepID=A0A1L9RRH1_ASPWE|nr:uncharacterized protein ASPWEDRAFT_170996 [Aspergillus wentii DTO 134E9]OJJ37525.1 hypothetical protein ASPWEDRAFT_170996 [Aspergillus wentii DTO 134E9]
MPHKHKRRGNDASTYDLPPTQIAKSLPVRDPNAVKTKAKKHTKPKPPPKATAKQPESRPKKALEDDTPRAFRRLMQFQQARQQPSQPSKPDEPKNKKRKRDAGDASNAKKKKSTAASNDAPAPAPAPAPAEPKSTLSILPGEKLSDFAARVDREMPLSAMKKSGKVNDPNMPKIREERRTKHEKHLRRLQRMWREDDKKIREREAAEREERQDEMEDQLELWKEWETEAAQARAKKKGGAKKGDAGVKERDPWAKLNKKERANKQTNPFDVVQAPPELKKPKAPFKVHGGAKIDVANVPTAVGSLRRREELADERRNIVEEYRRLMAEKRQ